MEPPDRIELSSPPYQGGIIATILRRRVVEAEGIEPSIPACKASVFPLALSPRIGRWDSNPHSQIQSLASCQIRRLPNKISCTGRIRTYGLLVNSQTPYLTWLPCNIGTQGGTRTHDPLRVKQVLSPLSYPGISWELIFLDHGRSSPHHVAYSQSNCA